MNPNINCINECDYVKFLEKEIKKLKKELNLYKKDPLTDTWVKRALDIDLKEEYIPNLEKKIYPFYRTILIDINDLHEVNRNQSYKAGDKLIVDVINFIKDQMKQQSIDGKIYRIGGDEFLIIYFPDIFFHLDTHKNFEFAHGYFNKERSFAENFNKMDKKIIKLKRKGKRK